MTEITADELIKLQDAALIMRRMHRNTTGLHSALINATRNADRIVLANDVDNMRLGMSTVVELLDEILHTQMWPTSEEAG